MAGKLKIGLFSYACPYPETGFNPGIETSIYYLLKNLSREAQVTIYTTLKKGREKQERLDGIEILRSGGFKIPVFSLNMFDGAANTLKEYRTKILQEDVLHDIGSFVSFWFHSLEKPSLVNFHHYEAPQDIKTYLTTLPAAILAKKYSGASCIVAPSDFAKMQFIQVFGCDKAKIEVIPWAADRDTFGASSAAAIKKKNIVLFCGSLSARKGPVYLIRAMPLVKKEIPGVKALIIGKGPQKNYLIKESISLNVQNDIEFLGYVPKEKLIEQIHTAAITVMPSLLEGFGQSALESMISATPVIASNIEPLISLIGKTGLYFPVGNHIALAQQIIRILKDDNLRDFLSKEAQEKAQEYSWEKTSQQYLRLYEELSSERSK